MPSRPGGSAGATPWSGDRVGAPRRATRGSRRRAAVGPVIPESPWPGAFRRRIRTLPWRFRRERPRRRASGAGRPPELADARDPSCAWRGAGGPRRDRLARPGAAPGPAGQRWRSSERRSDRSCPTVRWPTPGCARPRWLARRGRLRLGPPAAGPGTPFRPLTRWPRCASRTHRPSTRAVRPDARRSDLDTCDLVLVPPDGDRGVDALSGSTPIITFMHASLARWKPRGHSCLWTVRARSSLSHTVAKSERETSRK